MPDLDFHVIGVEPVKNSLTPLLRFKLRISHQLHDQAVLEEVQALILQVQIQIQAPQRSYSTEEQAQLFDIFGPPDCWSQTMHNRLWTTTSTTTGPFTTCAEATLPVPCTFDLNVLATKYFNGLQDGEVPLLFLFSGSMFYRTPEGHLQVQRISWEKDCVYKMPVRVWHDLMNSYYPNTAWLSLRRDVYERLCAFRRDEALTSWEEAMERLLPQERPAEATA